MSAIFPPANNHIKTRNTRTNRWLELKMLSLPYVRSNSPIMDFHMSAPEKEITLVGASLQLNY